MNQPANPIYTDRKQLTTQAYRNSANLMARVNIYQYQQPYIDFPSWCLEQIPWRSNETVVDVGCGPGMYLRQLAQMPDLSLTGLDLSRGMLIDLVKNWNYTFPLPVLASADIQLLPLADSCCDIALAMHMLYHVPDIYEAAKELRRVVRSGGTLLAATNSNNHLAQIHEVYHQAVMAVTGSQSEIQPPPSSRFSLENGADFLSTSFSTVERREIASTLIIPETEPLVRYLNSLSSLRDQSLLDGISWDTVSSEFERIIHKKIAKQGAFHVQTASGLFICS